MSLRLTSDKIIRLLILTGGPRCSSAEGRSTAGVYGLGDWRQRCNLPRVQVKVEETAGWSDLDTWVGEIA
jgi:hypothetical protein